MEKGLSRKEETALFKEYRTTGSEEIREKLILTYLPFVVKTIHRYYNVSNTTSVLNLDDFKAVGVEAMIKGIDNGYNPDKGASFSSYIEYRLRGAVIDELRDLSNAPRSHMQRMNEIRQVRDDFNKVGDYHPSDEDILTKFPEAHRKPYRKSLNNPLFSPLSINAPVSDPGTTKPTPLEDTLADTKGFLHKDDKPNIYLERIIDELPDNQRKVIRGYYYDKLHMRQIGEKMNLTESRISQIHTDAKEKLKLKLSNYCSREGLRPGDLMNFRD